ncbi:MAG: hypothetical protein M3Z08_19985, partial [Chloroflexota bacterium]|nr:hypothetical protein [Chloroflexota bacterium]
PMHLVLGQMDAVESALKKTYPCEGDGLPRPRNQARGRGKPSPLRRLGSANFCIALDSRRDEASRNEFCYNDSQAVTAYQRETGRAYLWKYGS